MNGRDGRGPGLRGSDNAEGVRYIFLPQGKPVPTVRVAQHDRRPTCSLRSIAMRRRTDSLASDEAEKVHETGETRNQAYPRRDQKISIVVSDGNYMNSELLARALSRLKTLTIL